MKIFKIILIFILAIPNIINALEFSTWSEEYPSDVDSNLIESEVKYKWYIDYRINEKYDIYEAETKQFIDMNDYKYTNYSAASIEYPLEKEYREIITYDREIIYNSNKFQYMTFDNFENAEGLEISEIVIKDAYGNHVPYTIEDKKNCDSSINNIQNQNFSIKALTIRSGSGFSLKLVDEYYIADVSIEIYIKNPNQNAKTWRMGFVMDKLYFISQKEVNLSLGTTNCYGGFCPMIIKKDSSWENKSSFEIKEYSYRDKLFKYYDLNKFYLKGYYSNVEEFTKVETDSKTFYRYLVNYNNEEKCEMKLTQEDVDSESSSKINNLISLNENYNYKQKENIISKKSEELKYKIIDNSSKKSSKIQANNKNDTEIFVTLSIIFAFILLIGKFIHKKFKNCRTI